MLLKKTEKTCQISIKGSIWLIFDIFVIERAAYTLKGIKTLQRKYNSNIRFLLCVITGGSNYSSDSYEPNDSVRFYYMELGSPNRRNKQQSPSSDHKIIIRKNEPNVSPSIFPHYFINCIEGLHWPESTICVHNI